MKQNKLLSSMVISMLIFLCIAGSVYAAQLPVDLGTAGDYVILTKTGISTTGTTSITGDIGVSPIDHTAITGFDLIGDPTTDTFLTSALVTGKIYAANLVPPTPSNIGTSISNMETAFTDAQGRTTDSSPEDTTELGAGDISGMTIVPGLHKWSTGVLINTGGSGDTQGITLDCSSNPNGVFIFQIAQDLTIGNGARITLIDCQAKNIFWAVDGGTGVSIGTTAHVEGNILASKGIVFNTGATLNGRALAQTAVTLDANTVVFPTDAVTPVLTTITVLPVSASLTIGSTQQLNASSFDQFGAPIVATINYMSNNSAVATVNVTSGLVTALTSGSATVTASSGNVNNSTTIVVSPVSQGSGNGGNSGGGSGGGSSGSPAVNWLCGDYSVCSASGLRTKTCTDSNTQAISTLTQICTPTKTTVVVNSTTPGVTGSTTDQGTPGTVLADGNGNAITGQVVSDRGVMPAWWITTLALVAVAGLGVGGYFYFRSPKHLVKHSQ